MARLGLQVRDSFSMSFTKFKIRRIRTALTLITTSILAMLLVIGSSVMTSFMRTMNATPQSELVDLRLARTFAQYSADPALQTPSASAADVKKATDSVRSRVKDNSVLRDVYVDLYSQSGETTLDLIGAPASPRTGEPSGFEFFEQRSVMAQSTALLKPYVDSSQSTNWEPGQPYPVLVPIEAVYKAHEAELKKIKAPKERVAKRDSYQKAVLGQIGKLKVEAGAPGGLTFGPDQMPTEEQPTTPAKIIPVRVVGFLPGPSITSLDGYRDFVFPYEVVTRSPELLSLFGGVGSLYPSFTTAAARAQFVDGNPDASVYGDTIEQNKSIFGPLQKGFKIAVIVMLVLMAIPMAATMSKLLSDSQRETGVFRAIGARMRHIVSIYSIYSLLMVAASYLLALLAGAIICTWISSLWADDLELAAADLGNTVIDVNFWQFSPSQQGIIFLGLLGGALLGIVFPLMRTLRRDPIKSLRDE